MTIIFNAKQRIFRRMNEKTDIEIPIHIMNQIIKVYLDSEKLKKTLGREAADKEIAESLAWDKTERVTNIKSFADKLMKELNHSGDVLEILGREIIPEPEDENPF
jgi:DNA-directed RNA polymerase sigma subunit (sigma70/sigma32)